MTLGDDVPKEYNMVVIDANGVREKKVRVGERTLRLLSGRK